VGDGEITRPLVPRRLEDEFAERLGVIGREWRAAGDGIDLMGQPGRHSTRVM